MANIFSTIGDKLGLSGGAGQDKVQYLLAGTLVLVIVISLVAAISTFGGKNKKRGDGVMHYLDVNTQEEFTMTPKELMELNKPEEGMPPMMMPGMPGMPGGMGGMGGPQVINTKTGERTVVLMSHCPKCEQWYAPEAAFSEDPRGMGMIMSPVCTKCGTNIAEYLREQRDKKKKKK